jgi:drug/metabolite transporter (DMT)-like permease
MIFFGIAMGLLFAVTYSLCIGRVGGIRPRALALLVAAGGFLGVYLVPFVKYPANPPSIGHPETIGERGGLYLLMVVCSHWRRSRRRRS